jgi:SET domain-containing protein
MVFEHGEVLRNNKPLVSLALPVDLTRCVCKFNACQADCLNAVDRRRCTRDSCVFKADNCGNNSRDLVDKHASRTLVIRDTVHRGKGIFTTKPLHRGVMLKEYIGIVYRAADCTAAMLEDVFNSEYSIQLGSANSTEKPLMYIDAATYGNDARYFNHSCEPNCGLEDWIVGNELRCFIRLTKDVKKNEELTIDYRWPPSKMRLCLCSSLLCRYHPVGFSTANQVHKSEEASIASVVYSERNLEYIYE